MSIRMKFKSKELDSYLFSQKFPVEGQKSTNLLCKGVQRVSNYKFAPNSIQIYKNPLKIKFLISIHQTKINLKKIPENPEKSENI